MPSVSGTAHPLIILPSGESFPVYFFPPAGSVYLFLLRVFDSCVRLTYSAGTMRLIITAGSLREPAAAFLFRIPVIFFRIFLFRSSSGYPVGYSVTKYPFPVLHILSSYAFGYPPRESGRSDPPHPRYQFPITSPGLSEELASDHSFSRSAQLRTSRISSHVSGDSLSSLS